jgi:hypothetical protein
MASLKIYYKTATNNNIITFCLDLNYILLGRTPYNNKVVKLFNITVVKFSVSVKEDKANN